MLVISNVPNITSKTSISKRTILLNFVRCILVKNFCIFMVSRLNLDRALLIWLENIFYRLIGSSVIVFFLLDQINQVVEIIFPKFHIFALGSIIGVFLIFTPT